MTENLKVVATSHAPLWLATMTTGWTSATNGSSACCTGITASSKPNLEFNNILMELLTENFNNVATDNLPSAWLIFWFRIKLLITQVHQQGAFVRARVLRPLGGARVRALLQEVRTNQAVVRGGIRVQERRGRRYKVSGCLWRYLKKLWFSTANQLFSNCHQSFLFIFFYNRHFSRVNENAFK